MSPGRISVILARKMRCTFTKTPQGHFALPEVGPIGSNCLANARDFQSPVASFIEDYENTEWTLYGKFAGNLFAAKQSHTPFDVVFSYGLYYPSTISAASTQSAASPILALYCMVKSVVPPQRNATGSWPPGHINDSSCDEIPFLTDPKAVSCSY